MQLSFARSKKYIKSLFNKPEKQLLALMPKLLNLKSELNKARMENPLDGIVTFFNAVSVLQDRGLDDIIQAFNEVNYGQYDQLIDQIKKLESHLNSAGRKDAGWNRTQKGEIVTADKVYLANIYGLWTKTVSYWKSCKDEKKGGWGFSGMETLNAYDVVSIQARDFMIPHIIFMLEIIDFLEKSLN